MSDEILKDNFIHACTYTFDFSLPFLRTPVDFLASFKSSISAEDAKNLISKLDLTRKELTITLNSRASLDAKLYSIDNYLPNIFHLLSSLSIQEKVHADKDLVFEWRGSFCASLIDYFKSNDVVYEIMMVLQAKAILHYKHAQSLLESDKVLFLSEAGKHLLTTTAVMEFMAQKVSSGLWSKRFNLKFPNPLDMSSALISGLSSFFLASAHAMAATKAINTDTTPPSVKARLCVTVVNAAWKGVERLRCLNSSDSKVVSLLTHVCIMRELYTALVYYYLAQVHMGKTEVGLAIGYCIAAKGKLAQQDSRVFSPLRPGLPKLKESYKSLASGVSFLIGKLNEIQSGAEQDNKFLYFQSVPREVELPPMPEEASIMKVTPFQEPLFEAPVSFIYEKPKSIFSTVFSWGSEPTGKRESAEKIEKEESPSAALGQEATSQQQGNDVIVKVSSSAPPFEG